MKKPILVFQISSDLLLKPLILPKSISLCPKMYCIDVIDYTMSLSGVVVNLLAFGPRGWGFTSRPCHYSTGQQPWASCLLTLPSQSSQLQETGYKREYSDRTDLTA